MDSESQLRSALTSADSNGSASNTINLTSSITLTDAAAGELSVDNTTGQDKTLTIQGTGTTPDQTVLSGSTDAEHRRAEDRGRFERERDGNHQAI